MIKLLIDGDIIARKASCAADSKKGGDQGITRAYANAKAMMTSLFMGMNTDNHTLYLGTPGDRTQHRYQIFPAYKENRKKIPYPKYLQDVREYLKSNYYTEVVEGIESDDILSIEQRSTLDLERHTNLEKALTCICTIDKDLKIVPGWHYHLDKKTLYWQTELEGLKCFYKQILEGDASDGIPRIVPRIVLTKEYEKLQNCNSEKELLDNVRESVVKLLPDLKDVNEYILKRGQILMPLKKRGEMWTLPNF